MLRYDGFNTVESTVLFENGADGVYHIGSHPLVIVVIDGACNPFQHFINRWFGHISLKVGARPAPPKEIMLPH
jgi:hypothetical protein